MQTFLKTALSLLALGYCLSLIELTALTQLIGRGDWRFLALAMTVIAVSTTLGAIRFKVLLDPIVAFPLGLHIKHYFMANFFNLLLPSAIGGDAARVLMLGAEGAAKTDVAVVVVLERFLGTVTLLTLSAVGAYYVADLASEFETAIFIGLGVVLTVTGLAVVSLSHVHNARHLWVARILGVLRQIKSRPQRVAIALALSLIFQLLNVSITYLVVLAYNLPASAFAVLTLVPLISIATSAPISISGIGVREVAFIYLFSSIGVAQEAGLLMSVGTYFVFILAGLIGGLWFALDGLTKRRLAAQ